MQLLGRLNKHKLKYDLNELFEHPVFEVPSINYNTEFDDNIWAFIANDILNEDGKLTKTMKKRKQAMAKQKEKMRFMDMQAQAITLFHRTKRVVGAKRRGWRQSTYRHNNNKLESQKHILSIQNHLNDKDNNNLLSIKLIKFGDNEDKNTKAIEINANDSIYATGSKDQPDNYIHQESNITSNENLKDLVSDDFEINEVRNSVETSSLNSSYISDSPVVKILPERHSTSITIKPKKFSKTAIKRLSENKSVKLKRRWFKPPEKDVNRWFKPNSTQRITDEETSKNQKPKLIESKSTQSKYRSLIQQRVNESIISNLKSKRERSKEMSERMMTSFKTQIDTMRNNF